MKIAFRQLLLFFILLAIPVISWSINRLNILVIVGDDWGGPYASAYTGIYGRALPSDIIKTPNIDRIARNGVLFKNAYVNAPSCTASRSSIFSGRYFFNTKGGAFLGGWWDSTIPTFPLLLRDAGYHIGKTSKGWAPGIPQEAPFGGHLYDYKSAGSSYDRFSTNVSHLMAQGLSFKQAKQRMLNQVRGNFEGFLLARQRNQPFLYWFGPVNTHRSWVKGSGKKLWRINPDNLKNKLNVFLPNVPEVREDMADYLGEIQALDAYVGVLLKKLEDIGELDNTLIVATGDNGPGFPRGKSNLYDFGVATPLVMWLPHGKGGRIVTDFTTLMDLAPTFLEVAGVPIPPKVNGRSLLNILKSPKSGQIDPRRTFAITGIERHEERAREYSLPYPARGLRTKNFLYIRNFKPNRWPIACPVITSTLTGVHHIVDIIDPPMPASTWIVLNRSTKYYKMYFIRAYAKRPAEELYDLAKDPRQIVNVAYNRNYAMTKAILSNKLLTELKKAGDPRVTGDGGTFDRPPYTDLAPVACQDVIPWDWLPSSK